MTKYSLDEMKDQHIGNPDTPERIQYEENLKMYLELKTYWKQEIEPRLAFESGWEIKAEALIDDLACGYHQSAEAYTPDESEWEWDDELECPVINNLTPMKSWEFEWAAKKVLKYRRKLIKRNKIIAKLQRLLNLVLGIKCKPKKT